MTAIAQDFWQEQADEPEVRIDGRVSPEREDAYWQSAYWAQPFHRDELGYDDYAPAFCVGYIGYAQYGGRFEDAEKSLCANWVRIKGDSRLSIDEAMQAIRAAWEHVAQRPAKIEEDAGELVPSELFVAQVAGARQPAYAAA
jgi:hypothetical protein